MEKHLGTIQNTWNQVRMEFFLQIFVQPL